VIVLEAITKGACPLFFVVLIAARAGAADRPVGLSVNAEGVLCKDSRPYRGIGVNYLDCFSRTLRKPGDTSYEQGFAVLRELGIPFARFMACGYWPDDMKLYFQDEEAYFRLMDGVVKSAEKHEVGLIASLFWFSSTVPDLMKESRDQWGNPASKTHEFMRRYTQEVVTRYKDSPAIWGWELGNEYSLEGDLPNAAEHRPPVVGILGTPATRTARDDLSHEMLRMAYVEFARAVRQHDAHRMITSGNAFPRPTAWHQWRENNWKQDSPEQYAQMLLGDNPEPMDVISVHGYGQVDIAPTLQIAQAAKRPLFVGEFGVSGTDERAREQFGAMLGWVERQAVPLAALWVYDYAGQNGQWNVTASNERSYQLKAVAEANRRLRGAGGR